MDFSGWGAIVCQYPGQGLTGGIIMIFDDDTEPKTKKKILKPLDKFSIDELAEYIDDLKTEIIRAETEMGKKKKHMTAVDALFKKQDD